MIRVGAHYLEARRIGYFLLEEVVLWAIFVLAADGMAHLVGGPVATGVWLLHGMWVTLALQVGLYFTDLHDLRTALHDALEGRRIYRALGVAVLLIGAALALGLTEVNAPALVAGMGATAIAALGLRAGLPQLGQQLALRTRLFLVGGGRAARVVVREVGREGTAEVVGYGGPRTTDIAARARSMGAEVIVVASDDRRGLPTAELLACRAAGLEVIDGARLAERVLHRLPVELVHPSDLIFSDGFARPLWLQAARRLLSIGAALVLVLLTWPLLVLTALLVKRGSPGPILYQQERVGRDGRTFQMLKFRTMRSNAEATGAQWAEKDDPRITPIGRTLRRYRIDELPQLWNVLRGDMELVGPRPERPEFVAQLRRRIPYYDLRHLVAPGITGYAQVCYPYAASLEEAKEKLQYDLYYVRHLSLALDFYVLLMTARVVLFGRGAR